MLAKRMELEQAQMEQLLTSKENNVRKQLREELNKVASAVQR